MAGIDAGQGAGELVFFDAPRGGFGVFGLFGFGEGGGVAVVGFGCVGGFGFGVEQAMHTGEGGEAFRVVGEILDEAGVGVHVGMGVYGLKQTVDGGGGQRDGGRLGGELSEAAVVVFAAALFGELPGFQIGEAVLIDALVTLGDAIPVVETAALLGDIERQRVGGFPFVNGFQPFELLFFGHRRRRRAGYD